MSEVENNLTSPDIYNGAESPDLQNLIRDQVALKEQIHDIENQWVDLNTTLETI